MYCFQKVMQLIQMLSLFHCQCTLFFVIDICIYNTQDKLIPSMISVSIRSHSRIAAGAEPNAHQFYVTNNLMGVVEWIETQEDIALTQKTRPSMQEQVRS
jgi:hypothetical protein